MWTVRWQGKLRGSLPTVKEKKRLLLGQAHQYSGLLQSGSDCSHIPFFVVENLWGHKWHVQSSDLTYLRLWTHESKSTKWGNIFCKNCVYPFSRFIGTWRNYVKEHWRCFDDMSKTLLLRHFMLCHNRAKAMHRDLWLQVIFSFLIPLCKTEKDFKRMYLSTSLQGASKSKTNKICSTHKCVMLKVKVPPPAIIIPCCELLVQFPEGQWTPCRAEVFQSHCRAKEERSQGICPVLCHHHYHSNAH